MSIASSSKAVVKQADIEDEALMMVDEAESDGGKSTLEHVL